jgi:tetratricopeptide (TPR) repeat protein
LALVCVQFCSPVLAASADSHLKDAEQAFAEKRFHAAEDLLNAAIVKNPIDQEAHLLLARTYVQLLDNKAAEHEYANCIKCNPFSAVGRMAHQETINIGGRSAADKARPSDDVKTVSKSVDAINREASDLKSDYGVSSHTMTPTYSQPASTAASRAARHADLRAARAASRAARMNGAGGQPGMQAYVPAVTSNAVTQPGLQGAYGQPGIPSAYARPGISSASTQPGLPSASMQPGLSAYGQPGATQTSAQARIDALRAKRDARRAARMSRFNQPPAAPYSPTSISASNTAPGVNTVAPPVIPSAMSMPINATQPYTPSTNLRASRQRGARAARSTAPSVSPSYNVSDAQVQQMHKQQEDAQHAQYAQDSANNLQRLMSEKQNPNSPKLRALGTNLFVRYYGSHDQDGSTASAPAADPVVEMKAKQMKLGDTK